MKKLPGLIWVTFVIVMLERAVAPGLFARLLKRAQVTDTVS
jgi:hypothetical protein